MGRSKVRKMKKQPTVKKEKNVEKGEDEAATFTAVARRQYENRVKYFSPHGHKCSKCWLITECCVCSNIAPVSTKHEYIIYMHQLEYLRGSNTGKILHMADPKTKMFICGQENEEELFELLKSRDPNRVMCLMPKDSVSIDEFVENAFKDPKEAKVLVKEPVEEVDGLDFMDNSDFFEENASYGVSASQNQPQLSKTVSSLPISELPPVTVVVLDGTWKQVKSLLNRLPFITRVHLPIEPDGTKSLLSPVRQQSTPDRICTLQAAIIAMEHLGEEATIRESLIKSLKTFMNSLLRQGGRKVKYDENDSSADLQSIVDAVNQLSYTYF